MVGSNAKYSQKYRKIGSYAGVIREFEIEKTAGGGKSGIKKIVNVYAHTSRTYPKDTEGIEVSKGLIADVDEGSADRERSWRSYTRWWEKEGGATPKSQKARRRTKKRGRGGRPLFSVPIVRLI